jgi:hypothetical protein
VLMADGDTNPQSALREIGLSAADIVVLCGLPKGFSDGLRPTLVRAKPKNDK